MFNALEIDKKKMSDIKSAAKLTGYSRDYITKLARDGKVLATQINRQWHVDLKSLQQYAEVSTIEQQIKKAHLSEVRRHERQVKEVLFMNSEKRKEKIQKQSQRAKQTVGVMIVMAMFLSSVLTSSLSSFVDMLDTQSASVAGNLRPVYADTTVIYGESNQTSVFFDETPATMTLSENDEGILLLPQVTASGTEVLPVDMFADSVVIRHDESGQAFISPADNSGSSTGKEIKFVMVPMEQNKTP